MTIEQEIIDYWSVKPPFKGDGDVHDLAWSHSISKHRYAVIPYLRSWMNPEAYAGKSVLEIGCGAGTDLLEFAKAGALVAGVDVTDTALKLTEERILLEGVNYNLIKIAAYSGKRLPYSENKFDLVYAYGVLHHTPFIDDLISEIHRVLKPGGRLKAMVYHKHSFLYYYSILYLRYLQQGLADYSRDDALSQYSEFREGCPFTRVYSIADLRDRCWLFSVAQTRTEYPVYDSLTERKIPITEGLLVKRTGIVDIDTFFDKVNKLLNLNDPTALKSVGWHLLVQAQK